MNVEKKKLIIFYQQVINVGKKKKHRAFIAILQLNIFTLQSLHLFRSISHSHSLYRTLSLIGLGCQFSCYFLGNQTEFNRSLSLALYLALALS